jgi:hypothetical protein
MALKVLHTRGVGTATVLRDFSIEGAAELGACTGAQSFRATRQGDGRPVLLHKFRPAAALLDLEPRIAGPEPPDFDGPFVTQFTDLFVAAGSAYLVELLPPGFALSDLALAPETARPSFRRDRHRGSSPGFHPPPAHASESLPRRPERAKHRAGFYGQLRRPDGAPALSGRPALASQRP